MIEECELVIVGERFTGSVRAVGLARRGLLERQPDAIVERSVGMNDHLLGLL